jgi:phosphate acetyltransferase
MPALEAEELTATSGHEKFKALVERAQAYPPTVTAVAHPCDKSSLESAVEGARLRLIRPILVGPRGKIEQAARDSKIDIGGIEIVDAEHSHDATALAAASATRAEALMKGSHHTDELMSAVVARETGLRTGRRISHCFIMDVPGHDTPLVITDAAVNIAPDLKTKVDIVQNAIDMVHAIGVVEARVAVLSAMETINPDVPSTLEAAALCKMADRGQITGQITGGILDGPLALDNAISPEAAAIKKIASPVAGRANVLVVPDLEAGNMLAKSLSFLASADAAGIVLGARVPIILTSRADALLTRLASCAVAVLLAAARRASADTAIP